MGCSGEVAGVERAVGAEEEVCRSWREEARQGVQELLLLGQGHEDEGM